MNRRSALPQRRSIRLKNYDYSLPGAYFITICSHKQRNIFGEIILGDMHLNEIGAIVNDCWLDIPRRFPNAQLDAHVAGMADVYAGPSPGSLSAIVRSFRAASTKAVREILRKPRFELWQRNYYDNVLRDAKEVGNARRYIIQNPARWHLDKYNAEAED